MANRGMVYVVATTADRITHKIGWHARSAVHRELKRIEGRMARRFEFFVAYDNSNQIVGVGKRSGTRSWSSTIL